MQEADAGCAHLDGVFKGLRGLRPQGVCAAIPKEPTVVSGVPDGWGVTITFGDGVGGGKAVSPTLLGIMRQEAQENLLSAGEAFVKEEEFGRSERLWDRQRSGCLAMEGAHRGGVSESRILLSASVNVITRPRSTGFGGSGVTGGAHAKAIAIESTNSAQVPLQSAALGVRKALVGIRMVSQLRRSSRPSKCWAFGDFVGRCPTPRRERGSLDPVLAKRLMVFHTDDALSWMGANTVLGG